MIELEDGIWIAPEHVTMIKENGKNECLIYFVGQGSLEGHIIPYAASEVAEAVEDSFREEYDEDEGDQEEE